MCSRPDRESASVIVSTHCSALAVWEPSTRAHDFELERDIALKTLHVGAASAAAIKRLRREIKLSVRINHPNVIRAYDLSQVGRLRFMTMEIIEGPSLKERLADRRISVEDACEIGRQIAQGLAAVHELGVVHRDLKPGNVLLGPDDRVVVADFGVAGEHTDATDASAIVGTVAYMSPEQANGEAASPAADIYALGVVLAEMLTGEVPLMGKGPLGTAMRRARETPGSLRALNAEIPVSLDGLVRRMLDPDPLVRPARATDVALALEQVVRGAPAGPAPVRPRSRRWTWAAAALVAVVMALAVLVPRLSPSPRAARSGPVLVPPDHASAVRVAKVRARLSHVWTKLLAGELDEGLAIARASVEDARTVGFDPLIIEALFEFARAAALAGAPRASSSYRSALVLAERIGYDRYVARAALGLLVLDARGRGGEEVAESLARTARAAIDRLGPVPELRVRYEYSVARGLFLQDSMDEAEAHARRGLVIVEQNPEVDRVAVMELRVLLAQIDAWRSLFRDSVSNWRVALKIGDERLGPGHPVVAQYRSEFSWPLAYVGLCDESLRQARQSEKMAREFRTRHKTYGLSLVAVANSLTCGDARDLDAAAQYATRGLSTLSKLGVDSAQVAEARSVQARIARLSGRLDDALRLELDSLRIRKRNEPDESSWTGESYFYLGLIHVARGELGEAQTCFDRCLELFKELGHDSSLLAYPLMGQGLVQLGRGRPGRAKVLLERAVSLHVAGQMMVEYEAMTTVALTRARAALANAGSHAARSGATPDPGTTP